MQGKLKVTEKNSDRAVQSRIEENSNPAPITFQIVHPFRKISLLLGKVKAVIINKKQHDL